MIVTSQRPAFRKNLVLTLSVVAAMSHAVQAQSLGTFEQRAQYALQMLPVKASTIHNRHIEFQLWFAESLYLRGFDAEANALVLEDLQKLHNAAHPDDDCFNLIAAVDLMERWSSHLHKAPADAATKLAYRSALTGFIHWDTAHTSNQLLMASAARFLASEAFPDATFASDFNKDDPTGRAYLLCIMNQIATHNLQEYDSDVYTASYFITLRLLADFAHDPEVRKRASMTYDWLLANAASTWLNSTWAASSFRRYFDIAPQNEMENGSWALWPYLGGPVPAKDSNIEHMLGAIQAIVSCQCVHGLQKEDGTAYRPRQEILDLASWKGTSYEFKARTVTPSRPAFQFMQSSYITHSFALFGETDFETSAMLKQGTKGSGAAIMSGVVWTPSAANASFPSVFYAAAPRWQVNLNFADPAVCPSGSGNDCSNSAHTYGFGRYGQYFQAGNAQLAVFNYNLAGVDEPKQFYIYAPLCTANQYPMRPPKDPVSDFPCHSAIIPRAMITSETASKGRLYLFYDNVLISFWLSAPFQWDGLHELSIFTPSKLNPDSLLASALEVASPAQFAGATDAKTLMNYKVWIESHASFDSKGLTGSQPSATYIASHGGVLKNTFAETNYLDGKAVDYTAWPLMSTPWVKQQWDNTLECTLCNPGSSRSVSNIGGGRNLVITSPVSGRQLTYDFVHWTVTEAEPPSPIRSPSPT